MIFSLAEKAKEKFQNSNTVNSSVWVAGGVVSGQAIRLLSNLILTRLLVPEYFGIMAIVQSVIGFFIMMTDVGLLPSVINTKRDKDPKFMQTVWTLQFFTASLICALVLIAAYPVSLIYGEPLLFPVLAFTALTSLMGGFNSVSILLEQKYIRQKQLVINQFISQVIVAVTMIAVAYFTGSIWALVLGNFSGVLFLLWASYKLFKNHYSSFTLEKSALHELVSFGKWIFVSSIFSYLSYRCRPLILGFFFSMTQFGVYVIAVNLAIVVEGIANNIANKVLAPKYRQLALEKNFVKIRFIRNRFVLLFLPPTILLAVSGEFLVGLLYDDRYLWAGPVLQLLVLGRVATLMVNTSKPLLTSLGDSKSYMYSQAGSAIVGLSIVLLVAISSTTEALVCVIAVLPFIDYCLVRFLLRKYKTNLFSFDLVIMSTTIAIVVFIWYQMSAESFNILMRVVSL